MIRQEWIDGGDAMAIVRQCVLAGVSRATVYAQQKPKPVDESDLRVSRLIDEEYTRRPFYGSRKMAIFLKKAGLRVNRKRVQRLMRQLGLAGMAPVQTPADRIQSTRPIPTCCAALPWFDRIRSGTDITYIRLPRGFAYLVAIIDWYSRRVLGWRISNSM